MAAAQDAESRAPVTRRTPTVEQFRDALAERHTREKAVDTEGVTNALLTFNLMRLQSRLSQDFESLHRKRGWTWSGFRIMNALWAVGPLEQRELARLSGGSRAAISSSVSTLERDGLVIRTRDSRDRRLVQVALTDRGTAALEAGMRDQAERERRWFRGLSNAQRQALSDTLAQLADQPRPS